MSDKPDEVVSVKCTYCGREDPNQQTICGGCGNTLSETKASKDDEKSKAMAVILAIVFGPLGLLYLREWRPFLVMLPVGLLLYIFTQGGKHPNGHLSLALTLGVRVFCAAWAYYTVAEQSEAPNDQRNALRLLDEAARLESADRQKAISAYEEIVRLCPDTTAGQEAPRNIAILRRSG